MSYDFSLFRAQKDVGVANKKQIDERLVGKGTSDPDVTNLSGDQLRRHLADSLVAKHPTFQEFQKDYKRIAEARSITESEARRRYRDIELTDNEGLQVTLFDDTATVTIPFSANPESRLRAAWDCLKVLELEGRFSTYDRQLGRTLDLHSDYEAVRACFVRATGTVDRTLKTQR